MYPKFNTSYEIQKLISNASLSLELVGTSANPLQVSI